MIDPKPDQRPESYDIFRPFVRAPAQHMDEQFALVLQYQRQRNEKQRALFDNESEGLD